MLEDYELDYGKPYAWLSWGGLILPEVVRNKDGSLMGFVRYGNGGGAGKLGMDYPEGWAMWLDKQHLQGGEALTLCLLWNPMKKGKSSVAWNGYGSEQVEAGKKVDHFLRVLLKLEKEAASLSAGSRVLRLGDVLTYLKTALQMVPEEVPMPDVPLYLDAVLSRDMDMKLYAPGSADKNRLNIRNREIVAIRLNQEDMGKRMELMNRVLENSLEAEGNMAAIQADTEMQGLMNEEVGRRNRLLANLGLVQGARDKLRLDKDRRAMVAEEKVMTFRIRDRNNMTEQDRGVELPEGKGFRDF